VTATKQPDQSPAPGIVPEPIRVYDANTPIAAAEQRAGSRSKRRNPVRLLAAKLMGALRGDKYMVDAYPAAERDEPARLEDGATKAQER
jgi:hypothetical protein